MDALLNMHYLPLFLLKTELFLVHIPNYFKIVGDMDLNGVLIKKTCGNK